MNVLMEIRLTADCNFCIRTPEQPEQLGEVVLGVFLVSEEHANKINERMRQFLCNVLADVLKGRDATPDDMTSSVLYKTVLLAFLPAAKSIWQSRQEGTMLI